jgi:hypothetical protein
LTVVLELDERAIGIRRGRCKVDHSLEKGLGCGNLDALDTALIVDTETTAKKREWRTESGSDSAAEKGFEDAQLHLVRSEVNLLCRRSRNVTVVESDSDCRSVVGDKGGNVVDSVDIGALRCERSSELVAQDGRGESSSANHCRKRMAHQSESLERNHRVKAQDLLFPCSFPTATSSPTASIRTLVFAC